MKSVAIFLLVFLLIFAALSGSRVSNLSVTADGRDIKISWEMLDQSGIRHFNVERRMAEEEVFTRINDRAIPLENSRKYEYIDKTVYKQESALVFYRVAIVETNGSVYYSDTAPLGKISSVRRTWGSIKSMFR